MGIGHHYVLYSSPNHPAHNERVIDSIKTSCGFINLTKNWAILPVGLRYKERMHYEERKVCGEKLAIGRLPGYHIYFFDFGWFEIAQDGTQVLVEDKMIKYTYNAAFLSFNNCKLVHYGQHLWTLTKVSWRHPGQHEIGSCPSGTFFSRPVEIETEDGIWRLFDCNGHEEVKSFITKEEWESIVDQIKGHTLLVREGSTLIAFDGNLLTIGCDKALGILCNGGLVSAGKLHKDSYGNLINLHSKYPKEVNAAISAIKERWMK